VAELSGTKPTQQRSRLSAERALDASLELLAQNSFDAFTVADVSRRAGVSVGAIYARFGSKESLLRAVHGRAMDVMTREHAARSASDGPAARHLRESVVDAVEIVAGVFDRNRDLLRAFMHLGAVDDVVSRRGSESSRELSRQFKTIVLEHRDEIGHADPDTAVDIAFRIAYCTFARQVMYGPEFESDLPVSWEELVPEVTAACLAYLLGARRSSVGESREHV
jgi:AcrR family transcriptional regulator